MCRPAGAIRQPLGSSVTVRLRNDTRLTTDAFDVAIAAGDIDLIPSARELVPSETERLTLKLGGPPLVVEADANQLQQALVNLALNARDAVLERQARRTQAGGAPEVLP